MENAEELQNVSKQLSETSDEVQNTNSKDLESQESKEEVTNDVDEGTEMLEEHIKAPDKLEPEAAASPESFETENAMEESDTLVERSNEADIHEIVDQIYSEPFTETQLAGNDPSDGINSDDVVSETITPLDSAESEAIPVENAETPKEVDTDTIHDQANEPQSVPEAESIDVVDEESLEEEQLEEDDFSDFEQADRSELLTRLKAYRNEENIPRLDKLLKAIRPRFDALFDADKNTALQQYIAEGNEADSFQYHASEGDKEFIALYGQLKAKRNKHYQEQQKQRDDNLKKKENLLEQLREIVDGEESAQSIDQVKALQLEWKKTGPVPSSQNKTLWANYNALLDRYYDHRSIYFELKDLDRKKNMALKLKLCEKAEALSQEEDLMTAVKQLNDLHEEYKHIGTVPKDEQENLWQRFKGASDAVYTKRKEYFDGLKVEFEANLVKKGALITEVETFLTFNSDRITEWNEKTRAIQEIQQKWEAIGGVPKDKAKETNRAFWNAFKKFFNNKNQFFKSLENQREENLAKKQLLVQQAVELQESTDWDSSAQKFKNLQKEWREVGPVPEKVKNEIYKSFKAACDHFFDRRREQNQEKFKAYEENLTSKLKICDQIEALASNEEVDLDDAYDLVDDYTAIGFVPKNAIKKINRRFEDAVAKILALDGMEERDIFEFKNHVEYGRLRNSPGGDRKIQRKEDSMKRKIATLENDISTWNTNIEFFANSPTADKLKADLQEKINEAEGELNALRKQLRSFS